MLQHIFKVPSALTLAQRELEHAKRDLLNTQAIAEHAVKMVEYHEGVVSRLTSYIQTESQVSN